MFDSSIFEKTDLFYLGRELDPESGKAGPVPFLFKNKNMTTHAALIGMTGSGKTGLGICLLEEAALDGIPAIVIDPKGDMGNLLLTFPLLRSEDFLPWVDTIKAEQKNLTREALARQTVETWKKGIKSWGQDSERIARLRAEVDMTLYTPGSSAGRTVSVLDSFDAPEPDVMQDHDTVSGLVNSTVSSILGLIGIEADPLKSREHILLSSILLFHWRRRESLNLETLIGNVVSPPLDRIGVFALENFYPRDDRMELAMQLNNIIASPAFNAWITGEPLQIERLLYTDKGIPRLSIFSIAHLSEPERMFFVTMLLGRLITWMRRQKGSGGLRCMLYMDEIFGYFPPTADPPAKKPMLLLLKQARAYGLGVVLATQNPVDLDYKGLANIGTWFIGRLQTRQDQDKVISGIAVGSGEFAAAKLRQRLANLKNRTFLMTSAHHEETVLFETRWALSYLKGPLSLSEIGELDTGTSKKEEKSRDVTNLPDAAADNLKGFSDSPPIVPENVAQCYVLPPVPVTDFKFIPWLAGSAAVRFFSQSRGIDVVEQVNLRLPLADADDVDWRRAVDNPVSPEDTLTKPPAGARYYVLPGVVGTAGAIRKHAARLSDYLYQSRSLELLRVPALKMESQPGELENQFQKRLADMLRDKREAETEKIEENIKKRQRTLEHQLARATDKVEREKSDVTAKKMDTALSVGIAVFGALFGRKRLSATTASRTASGVRNAGRLMKEKEDVRRAEEETGRIAAELTALAEEYQERTAEVAVRFSPANFPVEKFPVKPRRADIFDVQVMIQWETLLQFEEVREG